MRALLRILNVSLHVRGNVQTGAVLYCANHVSWLDIPCLRAVVDATFVAKSEIRRWPLVGGLAARAGTLFLKRGNHDATNRIADRMTWLLAADKPVLVFPEGTSTDGSTVLRFHARLYQAAIRVHGQVQAVAVRYPRGMGLNTAVPFVGEDDLAGHLWQLLGEDGIEAELHFGAALPADGRERRALANAAREQIVEALGVGSDAAVSISSHK
jgi:1-acyl-sn-glycerol-3-phosphate acyltransferase